MVKWKAMSWHQTLKKVGKKWKEQEGQKYLSKHNTKRKFQMLPKHPLILKVQQHGKHPHPKSPTKKMKKRNQSQRGCLGSEHHEKMG